MPSAPVHDFITVAVAVAAAPVALVAGLPPGETGALAATFLVGGLFFSPDLDLHSTPYMRWGPLRFMWWPYQVLIPHRSWLSHSLIVGGLLRLAYFAAILYALSLGLLLLLHLVAPVDPTGTLWIATQGLGGYIGRHPAVSLYVLGGFVASGATHVIADVIWSGLKRRFRRLSRRPRRG